MDNSDPLSNFQYTYANYDPPPNPYMYNVKNEPYNQSVANNIPMSIPQQILDAYRTSQQSTSKPATLPDNQTAEVATGQISDGQNKNVPEEVDTKENIELLPQHKKQKTPRKRGKTSNYWNKKIEDKNFPFYGCTICNVSFNTIQTLDEHVTIHKGRITSYDIRLRNQMKRKEKIKQMKKLKKLGKLGKKGKNLKKEVKPAVEIEIKPEDGYIGNEKASNYNETETANESKIDVHASQINHETGEINTDTKSSEQAVDEKQNIKETEDPRLQKLFKCFACQKQFSLSYYLRLHVRSHTDEKPYTCAECGQSFITASKLGRHNKRIHLAIRFQCRICYRFFSRFDILTRHFDKAHAAEKIEGEPYDYNAILPYLKELEEQLKVQSETKDDKPKVDDIWGVDTTQNEDIKNDTVDFKEKIEIKIDMDMKHSPVNDDGELQENYIVGDNPYLKEVKDEVPIEGVMVEAVKVEVEDQVEEPAADEGNHSDGCDNGSDEDYFPSNTWAATPKLEPPPPSPSRARVSKKRPGPFPMKCEFCEKQINSASYYKVHLRTHSGERPFKCYICGRGFITSSKMHRHVLTHQEYWGEDDENTLQKIKEEGMVKKEDQDDDTKPEKKKKSKKTGKTSMSKNKKKDGGPRLKKCRKRPHACIFCNKRFLHLETLQVHKKSHEGQEIVLKCNFCLEVMPSEEELSSHEASHTGPRPYLCTICNRTYTKKETMIYHRKSHSSELLRPDEKRTEYICDVCSKSFNAQCKLQRHLVSHKVEKFVLRYECPVCAHMFHTKYHIQMHLSTHQKEGLILEENRNEILAMVLQNARKIPKQSDFNVNVGDLIPADERSRVCNICGQDFQHFYYLEEHLKSHGSRIAIAEENKPEENKHICPVCNKGFKLHYYLKLHSFTHSKERPFICQQCGKGFITKGKLKRHLETHTGLKKFQCHICYKFFTRPSYLRIHVRTIHGTQDYNFSLNKF